MCPVYTGSRGMPRRGDASRIFIRCYQDVNPLLPCPTVLFRIKRCGSYVPRGTISDLAQFSPSRAHAERSERKMPDTRQIPKRRDDPDRKLPQVDGTQNSEADTEVPVIAQAHEKMVDLCALQDQDFPDFIMLPGGKELVSRVFAINQQEEPISGQLRINDDRLKNLRKPVDITEPQPFARAEPGAVNADIIQMDLMKIRASKIFLETLFAKGAARFAGGYLCVRCCRDAANQQACAVRMGREQMLDLGILLQSNHVLGGDHVYLVKFEQ